MKVKIGYYPILDMILAMRQSYSLERFLPFNTSMELLQNKLSQEERTLLIKMGEDSRGFLHVLERMIPLTLEGMISPEEWMLYLESHPQILWDTKRTKEEYLLSISLFHTLWLSVFHSEISKHGKRIFEKSKEISEQLSKKSLMTYLEQKTDRLQRIDENTLRARIKPEQDICFDKMTTAIILPTIFGSRQFSFWNQGEDYIFYISMETFQSEEKEPSDMLLLKLLALNDRTRLKMLRMLNRGVFSTGDMAEKFSMNSSTISRHFKVFKDAGYVDIFRQEGNAVYYEKNQEEIEKAVEMLFQYLAEKNEEEIE